MLASLVPLFDNDLNVKAYSVFTRKNNLLLNPLTIGNGTGDGSVSVIGFDIIKSVGMNSLSEGTDVFVSINSISIFSDIENQSEGLDISRIIILIDNTIPPVEMYVNRLKELKDFGFRIAVRKLTVQEFEPYAEILKLSSYIFLNAKKLQIMLARIYFQKRFPNILLVAGNVATMDEFDSIRTTGGFVLYEGDFYRIPVPKPGNEIAPVKVTYIELLNLINDSNFELTKAADIISKDPALTISLLKMVNKMSRNSEITTIRHAAAMLGQRELKKWINTAVVDKLYADKPSEITRLALIRAKYSELLASEFELAMKKDELFLAGLFSVLDVILEKPMEEALKIVKVSPDIEKALLKGEGALAKVLNFVVQHESANWHAISRDEIYFSLDDDTVSQAYINALEWYRDLMLA